VPVAVAVRSDVSVNVGVRVGVAVGVCVSVGVGLAVAVGMSGITVWITITVTGTSTITVSRTGTITVTGTACTGPLPPLSLLPGSEPSSHQGVRVYQGVFVGSGVPLPTIQGAAVVVRVWVTAPVVSGVRVGVGPAVRVNSSATAVAI